MQVVLVYLQQHHRNSLLTCVSQPVKSQKKFTKTQYFGGSRSSMLVPMESSSAVSFLYLYYILHLLQ